MPPSGYLQSNQEVLRCSPESRDVGPTVPTAGRERSQVEAGQVGSVTTSALGPGTEGDARPSGAGLCGHPSCKGPVSEAQAH